MQMTDKLLTSKEVLAITGYRSQTSLWRKRQDGSFPAPIIIGTRTLRWRQSDIDTWLEQQTFKCGGLR